MSAQRRRADGGARLPASAPLMEDAAAIADHDNNGHGDLTAADVDAEPTEEAWLGTSVQLRDFSRDARAELIAAAPEELSTTGVPPAPSGHPAPDPDPA
ncbi:hypothetical protein ACFW2V_00010 [Streptomyces sp. NPDC058947]|uniref:hypothetical protein n=1 Tax=Streptomyces sp. NPDC058947 TaxID=3346675 RepID=UPI00368F3EDF